MISIKYKYKFDSSGILVNFLIRQLEELKRSTTEACHLKDPERDAKYLCHDAKNFFRIAN